MRRVFLMFPLAAVALTLFTVPAFGLGINGFFKTPSGKIVCEWATFGVAGAPRTSVECGVATGLKPPIPKTGSACQHLDYVGNRVGLLATGHVQLIACAGDAGPFGEPGRTVYLHYGKSWKAGGIVCTEATRGLTCRNRNGHGFFLSLRGWRAF
jgi:Family of unknown function (DUF6636)